jgi:hypothetical protein
MARSSSAEFPVPRFLTLQVCVAAALSWLGLYVHNVADLPGQTMLRPESAGPAIVTLLLIGCWISPARRVAAWLLLGWAWLNLGVGAVLSVLPLALLPSTPEQSPRHYALPRPLRCPPAAPRRRGHPYRPTRPQ